MVDLRLGATAPQELTREQHLETARKLYRVMHKRAEGLEVSCESTQNLMAQTTLYLPYPAYDETEQHNEVSRDCTGESLRFLPEPRRPWKKSNEAHT